MPHNTMLVTSADQSTTSLQRLIDKTADAIGCRHDWPEPPTDGTLQLVFTFYRAMLNAMHLRACVRLCLYLPGIYRVRLHLDHSNSGLRAKKFLFDSIRQSDKFALVHWYSNSKLGVIIYSMHCVTVFCRCSTQYIAFICMHCGVF